MNIGSGSGGHYSEATHKALPAAVSCAGSLPGRGLVGRAGLPAGFGWAQGPSCHAVQAVHLSSLRFSGEALILTFGRGSHPSQGDMFFFAEEAVAVPGF